MRRCAVILCLLLCLLTGCGERQTLTLGVYSGSYWGTPSNDCYQLLDDVIARFEAEHPGVQVEYVSGIGPDFYSEWLSEKILLGTEPDVYFVLPEDFALLVECGALERLDGRMAEDPEFDASVYYDSCLRSGFSEGHLYALPYESVPTMMFVNQTLLEEHGLTVPGNDWTWEDFYRICAEVTDVENHQFGVYDYSWTHALYSNGAELFSGEGDSCNLADERVQEAVRFVQRLEALNEGYTVTSRDFDLGRVAFRPFLFSEYRAYQPYPWRVKKYSGFEWECVCMPAGPSGGNTSELSTMLLGISSRSRNRSLAWDFLKVMSCQEETQKKLYTSSYGVSPLSAVAESPELLRELYDSIPGSVLFRKEVIGEIMRTGVTVPRFRRYEQAMSMAESAVSQGLNSGEGLQIRLQTAQRAINIFLSGS